jgi:hypothetical protein
MNSFAAAAILSQISLHDFLALSPGQRLQFAQRIPLAEGMIVGSMCFLFVPNNYSDKERLNEAIAQRREDFNIYVVSEDGDSEMQGA